MKQLTIFDEIRVHEIHEAYPIIHKKAHELLEIGLNCDRKPKDKFTIDGFAITDSNDFIICAKNGNDMLFNALDFNGNVPENPCWRSFHHIKRELKIEI